MPTLIRLATLACLLSLPLAAQEEPRSGGEGRRGERRQKALERFDANGDGRLDEAERQKLKEEVKRRRASGEGRSAERRGRRRGRLNRKRLLERFDENGNGKLDPAERDALRGRLEERRGRRSEGGRRGKRGKALR